MLMTPRLQIGVIVLSVFTTTLFGASPAPLITAAASGERVRFSAPSNGCQIRLEILLPGNESPQFDSGWQDGNVFDWPADIPSGSYRCVVRVRELDGQVTAKEGALIVQDGRVSIESRGASDGLTVLPAEDNGPKVTLLAHDGTNGAVISTSGDLTFRFGNFLAGRDSEKMRLTADGELRVEGPIRATKGIILPDGTTLTTATGVGDAVGSPQRNVNTPQTRTEAVRPPILPLAPLSSLRPRTNFVPAYQFVVGAAGVNVGTTDPTYNLNVTGPINTATEYDLAGSRLIGGDNSDLFVGYQAGFHNAGGTQNFFFGSLAGYNNNTGSYNSMFGWQPGIANTTGSQNTYSGAFAGDSNQTGSNNSAFGYGTDIANGVSGSTAIGIWAKATQSNTLILGGINGINNATVTTSTGIATQTPNQYLGVGGGITVDENNLNDGTLLPNSVIAFGTGGSNGLSGEGIASQRSSSGSNQYGLDFYTLYIKRMSISNNGNVTIPGNLWVQGNVLKGSGSFKIDDPSDPENKYLSHSFVESPDMMNIYNGNVVLDDRGEAVVQLPGWFEALNSDFRYQLTCLHGFAPVYIDEEISGNHFRIAGGKPGMKVSWQVTGIRHDPFANAHRIPVEEEKPANERGTYLHPVEYGQPPERGLAQNR